MKVFKNCKKEFYNEKVSLAERFFEGTDSQLNLHHIDKSDGIQVKTSTDIGEANSEVIYFVLHGKVALDINNERQVMNQDEAFMICGDATFIIWALETSDILYFSRSISTLRDSIEPELQKMLEEAEAKDVTTKNHNKRVARIAARLAYAINPDMQVENILTGASFHDIGKIKIPSEILNKNGKLTPEEFSIIKEHPIYSADILKGHLNDEEVFIAKHHQELLDGSGYPDGLKGDKIPFSVRVVTVADIYDALTSERPYRKKLTSEEAFKIMDNEFKGKIDPSIYNKLKEMVRNNSLDKDIY